MMRQRPKSQMRVQVKREVLIQALERKQRQCQKEYEKFHSNYMLRLTRYRNEIVRSTKKHVKEINDFIAKLTSVTDAQLVKMAKAAELNPPSMKLPGSYPFPPRTTDGYATILRMLRMSDKTHVSLSEDQFRSYMDGCPL